MASLTLDQKIDKFTEIMHTTGFDKLNQFALRSAIEVPELKEFFDWFCSHVNETWLIPADRMAQFKEKLSRGHVIFDLNKLIETDKILNETTADSQKELETENERIEKECQLLADKLKSEQLHKQMLNNKFVQLKSEQSQADHIGLQLDKRFKLKETELNSINQSIETCLQTLQDKLGSQAAFHSGISAHLDRIEANYTVHVANEKSLLKSFVQKMFLRFDYDHLEKSIKLNEAKSERENFLKKTYAEHSFLAFNEKHLNNEIEKEYENVDELLKLIVKYYPDVIQQWFTAKLNYQIQKCNNFEMNKIIEDKSSFFVYTQEQLDADSSLRHNLEANTRLNNQRQCLLLNEIEAIKCKVPNVLEKFSQLKVIQIIEKDMKTKQIELNLFLTKQDKLISSLLEQNKRLNTVHRKQTDLLARIDSLHKELTSLMRHKPAITSAFTSTSTGNLNFKPGNDASICQAKDVSFSCSMANLLSCSVNFNNPLTPSKFGQNQNSTLIAGFTNKKQPITHSVSYSNLSSISTSTESAFTHLINQFMITVLTGLKSDKLAQKYIKLAKPISVNFSDNLENLLSIHEAISINGAKLRESNMKTLFELFKLIDESMEYMYEKNESNGHQVSDINLSRIKIESTRFMEEPLEQLERQRNALEQRFAQHIYPRVKRHADRFKSNRLEQLKRNMFVIFYTKPHLIESIIESMN